MVAPFLLLDGTAGVVIVDAWGDILVGLVLSVFGLLRCVAPHKRMWLSPANIVIGIWLVAAAVLPFGWPGVHPVNDIVVGVVVVLMATSSTTLTLIAQRHARRTVTSATTSPPGRKQ
nr:hypothetical protein [Kibdelosporangium sp. MJ126-NF4]